jgi:hypothetical protein
MSSVSRPREQGTAWFPKLKNEPVCSHPDYITSCLFAHCLSVEWLKKEGLRDLFEEISLIEDFTGKNLKRECIWKGGL